MQNQQGKSGRFMRFVRQKGYYMVLVLCIVAVGVSGWIFIRTAMDSPAEQTLGEEVSVSLPAVPDGQPPQPITPDMTEETQDPAQPPDVPEQPNEETSTPVQPEPDLHIVRPVSGDTVQEHSVDRLIYNSTMRDWRTHDGVDIACAAGTQVRAAMAGTVSAVYDDDFLGTVVELRHTAGYTTCYANLTQMPTVSEGDSVQAGQVIGAVGTTALGEASQTAHLHFSVQQNGSSIDPAEFLN